MYVNDPSLISCL